MFDMHYDLLTVAYISYLNKDFTYLEKWCHAYRENNVTGVFANLYFMSKEEMKEELHQNYFQENISVIEMFKKSKEIIETLLPELKIVYSIEGCDYLEVEDLDELYELGLRSILPVWNEKNKYASGNRSNKGLTEEGKKLLDKAISLGIAIDLSHANEPSFFDMINYINNHPKKEEAIVYASHSNARSLCARDRNLKDQQLLALKEVKGSVGVFSNRNFVVESNIKDTATQQEKEAAYLAHINYMVNCLGIDHVCLATDDMNFCVEADSEYGELAIFPYDKIAHRLENLLKTSYQKEDCNKLLYKNAEQVYHRLIDKKEKEKKI